MEEKDIVFDHDLMEEKEFILKRQINSRWLDVPKLLFIVIMFPFFVIYTIFLNKFSKIVLSKVAILIYLVLFFLFGIMIFKCIASSDDRNSNEYKRIPIEFYDKIKKF